jgi:hypothetical protein
MFYMRQRRGEGDKGDKGDKGEIINAQCPFLSILMYATHDGYL